MENLSKKMKFPIGCIFLLVWVLYNGVQLLNRFKNTAHGGLEVRNILFALLILCIVALTVLIFMKKTGLPMVIVIGAAALIRLIDLILAVNVPFWDVVYVLAEALAFGCLILNILNDLNVKIVPNYNKNLFKIIFLCLVAVLFVCQVVFYATWLKEFIYYDFRWIWKFWLFPLLVMIFYLVGIALCGLWIFSPFVKETDGVNNDENNSTNDRNQ